jgi:hypothetical protein
VSSIPHRPSLAASAWWAVPAVAVLTVVVIALVFAMVSRSMEPELLGGSGSFEDPDLPGWTVGPGESVAASDAVDGTRVLRITGDGVAPYPGAVSPLFADVAPDQTLRLTASGRRVAGFANGVCRVDTMRDGAVVSAGAASTSFTTSGAFVEASDSLTIPEDGSVDALRVLCFIGAAAPPATESWEFDAVTLVGFASSGSSMSQGPPVGVMLLIAACVALFGVLVVRLRRRPSIVVGLLCLWFAAQNVVAALAAPHAPTWVVVGIIVAKEVMYVAIFAIGVGVVAYTAARRRLSIRQALARLQPVDWLAIAFVLLVGVAFLLSGEPLSSRLINARRLASLPILYLAGRTLLANRFEFSRAARILIGTAVVVSILGLVELLILGNGFWRDIVRILELQGETISGGIQSALQHARDGLPLNWWSHLIIRLRRLVSTFLEPTTLSIFLALTITLAPFVLVRRPGPSVVLRGPGGRLVGPRSMLAAIRGYVARWDAPAAAVMTVLIVAMLLTLGKGGWMILATVALTCVLSTTRRSIGRLVAVVAVVGVVALAVGSVIPGVGPNINAHVDGLITGALQLVTHPLGSGLGSTGFWGANLDVGTDSTAGVIASQLGLPGIVIFAAWAALMVFRILPAGTAEDTRRRRADPALRRALAGALLGLFGLALLSTSATGLLGSAFYLLLGGWMVSLATRDRWPRAAPNDAP